MTDAQDTTSVSPIERNPSSDLDLPPDLLADLPDDKRSELIELVSQIEVYGSFSGPLPPPAVLNLYEDDARQAIVSGFVANGRHRRASESRGQILFFVRDILSLLIAFALAFRLIDGSIYSIQQGQSIEGLLGIGGTVAVIAGAFLFRDRKRRQDRLERQSDSPDGNSESS